jgi:transcriptional regulator with XRE-family HTH domain
MKNFSIPQLGGVISVRNKALVAAIGTKIRALRTQNEISQEDLANEADIPLSQVGRIERGEGNPTISTLYVIAKALKTDLRTLVDVKLAK